MNAAVVGPNGLIDVLEIQLGLTGPGGVEAVRIASHTVKLRRAIAKKGDRFFAASFAKDPWATACLVLSWRDTLVAAGWSQTAIGSTRVDDLAATEQAASTLPPGLADRVAALAAALACRPLFSLQSLILVEETELLPPAWRRILAALAHCGVTIREPSDASPAEDGSDLRRVQDFLRRGEISPLSGDGSFVLVRADTALMAAEALAEWLAAGSEDELSGTVVLSPDGDTALLDRTLATCGLPALG